MKYLYAIAQTPNGATVNVHRLHRVSLDKQRVLLTLNHFVDADQELPTWQDEYEMPIEAFVLGAYPDCVWDWIAGTDGLFPGGQILEEADDFENTAKMARHKIERLRDGHVAGGVTVGELGTFQTDPTSVTNIMGAFSLALAAVVLQQPFSVDFKRLDDTYATLDAARAIQVGGAAGLKRSQVYAHSWTLKTLVDAAQTVEEIEAIDLNEGWPA